MVPGRKIDVCMERNNFTTFHNNDKRTMTNTSKELWLCMLRHEQRSYSVFVRVAKIIHRGMLFRIMPEFVSICNCSDDKWICWITELKPLVIISKICVHKIMLDYFERWLQICKRHIGKKILQMTKLTLSCKATRNNFHNHTGKTMINFHREKLYCCNSRNHQTHSTNSSLSTVGCTTSIMHKLYGYL